MKKINGFIILLILLTTNTAYSQVTKEHIIEPRRKGKFMVGVAFDVLKTNFEDRVGNKLQGGLEVNYFLAQNFSLTAGAEAWTGDTTSVYSGVAGIRYYPLKKIFIRARGLIGVNELSAGAGFKVFLDEKWSAEGMIDAFTSGNVAARVGVSYLLVKRNMRKP